MAAGEGDRLKRSITKGPWSVEVDLSRESDQSSLLFNVWETGTTVGSSGKG